MDGPNTQPTKRPTPDQINMIADRIWTLHAKYPVYSYEKRRLQNLMLAGADTLSQWQRETLVPETLDVRYDRGWTKDDLKQVIELLNVREAAAPVLGINRLPQSHEGLGDIGTGLMDTISQDMMQARRRSWLSSLFSFRDRQYNADKYSESDDQMVGGPMNGVLIIIVVAVILLAMFCGGLYLIYFTWQMQSPSSSPPEQKRQVSQGTIPGATSDSQEAPPSPNGPPSGADAALPLIEQDIRTRPWTTSSGALLTRSGSLVHSGMTIIRSSVSSLSSPSGSGTMQLSASSASGSLRMPASSSLSSVSSSLPSSAAAISSSGRSSSSSAPASSSGSLSRSSVSSQPSVTSMVSSSLRSSSASSKTPPALPSSASVSAASSAASLVKVAASASSSLSAAIDHLSEKLKPLTNYPVRQMPFSVIMNHFTDLSSTGALSTPANELAQLNILSGYSDKTFRPSRIVNRAELTKMIILARFESLPPQRGDKHWFTDVPSGSWFEIYAQVATDFGILERKSDALFHPANAVSTVDFLKMIATAFTLPTDMPFTFSDVPDDSWYKPYAGIVGMYDLLPNRPKDLLQPTRVMTRGEVALAIHNLLTELDKQKRWASSPR